MSPIERLPVWVREYAGIITLVITLCGAVIGIESRYVTTDELAEHTKAVRNHFVHKELTYAIERCTILKERLKLDRENFSLKIDYESCKIKRDALKREIE